MTDINDVTLVRTDGGREFDPRIDPDLLVPLVNPAPSGAGRGEA